MSLRLDPQEDRDFSSLELTPNPFPFKPGTYLRVGSLTLRYNAVVPLGYRDLATNKMKAKPCGQFRIDPDGPEPARVMLLTPEEVEAMNPVVLKVLKK